MEHKIKICYVINAFAVGGAETVAWNLSRKLPTDQYEVTVLSVLEPDPHTITPMRQRFLNENVRTEVMNLGSIRNPLAYIRLLYFLKRNHFDIIHGHNRPSDSWSVMVGKYAGIPHRLWTRHLVYKDMSARQLNRYHNLSRQVPLILAVSDSVRQNCIEYEGIPEAKVKTVVNGIDTELFAPIPAGKKNQIRNQLGCPDDTRMLLFVGRLADQKAPEGFIQIVQRLRQQGLKVQGYLCGTGPLATTLEKMASPDSGVTLLGLRNDVPDLLATADLFVSTSRNEGLPLNVMEAMSTGTPVVAPDIGQISCLFEGFPELEEGLFSPPPQSGPLPEDLISRWAAHTANILENKEQLLKNGHSGRLAIEQNYSLKKMVAVHSGLYKKWISTTHQKGR